MNYSNEYDDIINLEHHTSKIRKRMSIENRAAQFAPFSALTGYAEEINETSRLTDKRIEISDDVKNTLNNKLQKLKENIKLKPYITVTYFMPDEKKKGGKYVTFNGYVKKIDETNKIVVFDDNKKILMNDIVSIIGNSIKMEDEFCE